MIWSTWRQHRTTLLAAVGSVLLLALVAVVCGLTIRGATRPEPFGNFYGCMPGDGAAECWAESTLMLLILATVVLPVLLGVLVGVTVFSRDIEPGTHVLGLSQSVSRARWYWTRVLVVFVPATLAMVVLGSVLEWTRTVATGTNFGFVSSGWAGYSTLTFPQFQSTGLIAGAYTFMALILGSLLGLLLRNTLGAMAVTLVAMTALLVGFQAARPQYATPVVEAQPLDRMNGAASYIPDDTSYWLLKSGYVDSRGNYVDVNLSACDWIWIGEGADWDPRPDETGAQFAARQEILQTDRNRDINACMQGQGADHFEVHYQPNDLFRRFQLIEVALALALSALLLIPSLWALRRLRP